MYRRTKDTSLVLRFFMSIFRKWGSYMSDNVELGENQVDAKDKECNKSAKVGIKIRLSYMTVGYVLCMLLYGGLLLGLDTLFSYMLDVIGGEKSFEWVSVVVSLLGEDLISEFLCLTSKLITGYLFVFSFGFILIILFFLLLRWIITLVDN